MSENKGWECPRCHRCYAPDVKECPHCPAEVVVSPVEPWMPNGQPWPWAPPYYPTYPYCGTGDPIPTYWGTIC